MNPDKFHKREHARALKGMERLSLEQRGAYQTLQDLMYLHGGPIADDDDDWFAGKMKCSKRKWRAVRDELLELGRIWRDEAGFLHDDACDEALAVRATDRASNKANGSVGGKKSAEMRVNPASTSRERDVNPASTSCERDANPNKNNADFQPPLQKNPSIKDCKKEEEESGGVVARARVRSPQEWATLVEEALALIGEQANRTTGGFATWAPLQLLVEPPTGPPCDWEADVLPAIAEVAANCANANDPLRSWRHPAIAANAIRNRNNRLRGVPNLENTDAQNPKAPRNRRGPASDIAAAVRAAAVVSRRLDANEPSPGLDEGAPDRLRIVGAS